MNVPVSPKADFRQQAQAVSGEARKQRILIVDDVADNRDILSRRLSRRGYDIMEACNGTEALQKIAEEEIDIVLLDIMMPDILGTDVVREVRKTRTPGELPIIMVSAKARATTLPKPRARSERLCHQAGRFHHHVGADREPPEAS